MHWFLKNRYNSKTFIAIVANEKKLQKKNEPALPHETGGNDHRQYAGTFCIINERMFKKPI